MSEQSEKLISIILPDLLNYLEMVESGEIIERRIKKDVLSRRKEDDKNLPLLLQYSLFLNVLVIEWS